MIHWTCKTYRELTLDELYAILKLRSEVFVVEQDCVYLDLDDKDNSCWHLMGMEGNRLVAYMRIIPPGVEDETAGSIGRIVITPDYRGTGLGHVLVDKGIAIYNELVGKAHPIVIHAQSQLERFYSQHGFKATSKPCMFEGLLHTNMMLVQRKVLFLHGFFASGQCIPALALMDGLSGKAEVISPDLPIHPKEAKAFIVILCKDIKPDLIVGNSCGSFYAQQVANELGIPALLGNPHFKMTEFLRPRIGNHQYKSQRCDGNQDFTIDEALIAEFAEMEAHQFDLIREDFKDNIWGLFGDNDTLAHFEPIFLKHYSHSSHFPGGHTPTADEVKDWYVPMVKQMLQKCPMS